MTNTDMTRVGARNETTLRYATDPEVGGAEQRSLDIGMVAPDPYGWVCERIERTRYDRLVVLSMLAVGRR